MLRFLEQVAFSCISMLVFVYLITLARAHILLAFWWYTCISGEEVCGESSCSPGCHSKRGLCKLKTFWPLCFWLISLVDFDYLSLAAHTSHILLFCQLAPTICISKLAHTRMPNAFAVFFEVFKLFHKGQIVLLLFSVVWHLSRRDAFWPTCLRMSN